MRLFIRVSILLSFLYALFISSCTVNYSFTGADIPAEAKTISVGLFTVGPKATLANPAEGDRFTNALITTMLTQTNLDMIEDKGDLRFEGSIVNYTNTAVAMQSDTEASNRNRLTMTVNVIYTNTIEPEKSFERTFKNFADFDAADNLSDVEEELMEVINQTISQDIFNASIGSW